uniref:C-type lectin domain-containing protein n=1 Tax=Ascaris lumbricoides TaxID=6252 RepID=A0A0M3I0G1_ASCLU
MNTFIEPPPTTTTTLKPTTTTLEIFGLIECNKPSKFRNHEYTIVTQNITWNEHEFECVKRGGHLTSIHSAEEHIFLRDLIKNCMCNSTGVECKAFIGLTSTCPGPNFQWRWTDKSEMDYNPIDSFKYSSEQCGEIVVSITKMTDYLNNCSCRSRNMNSICKKRIE